MFSISYFRFVYCLSVGSCIAVTELVLSYSSLIYLPHIFPNPCRGTMYSDRSWQFWVKYGEGEYIALLCWVQFGLQIWVTGYSRLWRPEQDSAAAKRPNMEAREDVEHSFCWPDGGFCHFLDANSSCHQNFLANISAGRQRKTKEKSGTRNDNSAKILWSVVWPGWFPNDAFTPIQRTLVEPRDICNASHLTVTVTLPEHVFDCFVSLPPK